MALPDPERAMPDPFDLDRFVRGQDPVLDQIRRELRAGAKRSHWMWFVFPRSPGWGTARWRSATPERPPYARGGKAEQSLPDPEHCDYESHHARSPCGFRWEGERPSGPACAAVAEAMAMTRFIARMPASGGFVQGLVMQAMAADDFTTMPAISSRLLELCLDGLGETT